MRHMTQNKIYDFIVIGCGISGLLTAKKLTENGASVLILDKGRNFGGRMATRFFDGAIFDHGAQFFTVRMCCSCVCSSSDREGGYGSV